ncbi:hypothetical protein LRR81_09775 [Metabacillus sp. GX 13764]|uniref:hypothetical protein n=1 Tax=Metabacillus kandeliae TaxID=2900151 RepID=UPI001E6049C5|nr:hypothetical protein [Metabacillus kandeliae]MCD7034527.1 hypothetical protein [Metabacillus kandeliae]
MKFHIINTNKTENPACEADMLENQKCAAYFGRWKKLITKIQRDDRVFLYSNGKGIIARGIATGQMETADYKGEPDEEYFMHLNDFQILQTPIPPSAIKQAAEMTVIFNTTMFTFRDSARGATLWETISLKYM